MLSFSGRYEVVDDTHLPASERADPHLYSAWVKERLAAADRAIIRFRHPRRTAAFSPQDTTHPQYAIVKEHMRERGFAPIERGTGGRLTLFDENALAITIITPMAQPHLHMIRRYEELSTLLVMALRQLGVDARVGELPDEYCPGKFSINAGGKTKLVGIAQRMNQLCVQMGAIISVARSEAACAGIAAAYGEMDLRFDPQTYGAILDLQPALTAGAVSAAVKEALVSNLAT